MHIANVLRPKKKLVIRVSTGASECFMSLKMFCFGSLTFLHDMRGRCSFCLMYVLWCRLYAYVVWGENVWSCKSDLYACVWHLTIPMGANVINGWSLERKGVNLLSFFLCSRSRVREKRRSIEYFVFFSFERVPYHMIWYFPPPLYGTYIGY
jgi:hypothetical protein